MQCFPFARQDGQDNMKNKQTITKYFGNFVLATNQKGSFQNGMKCFDLSTFGSVLYKLVSGAKLMPQKQAPLVEIVLAEITLLEELPVDYSSGIMSNSKFLVPFSAVFTFAIIGMVFKFFFDVCQICCIATLK